ncbi:MAG: hypothetical protein J0I12_05865 [Candidatus Eremiobacteraeota bacterium]|nr:hypothetical protein [Candidatus Eremiobacteraeota bacterium]
MLFKRFLAVALLTSAVQAAPVLYNVTGRVTLLPGITGETTTIQVGTGDNPGGIFYHSLTYAAGGLNNFTDPTISLVDNQDGTYDFAFSDSLDDDNFPFGSRFSLTQTNGTVWGGSTPQTRPANSSSPEVNSCFAAPGSFSFTGGGFRTDQSTATFDLTAIGLAVVPELSPASAALPLCLAAGFLALAGSGRRRQGT